MHQGAIVGDEPCLPIGNVALNVSSSKFDDVAANASKVYFFVHIFGSLFFIVSFVHITHFFWKKIRQITDVERGVVLSGGDDARCVPLSSGCNVGNKVADEDGGAASILDAKSPGVGIAGNENVPDCEDLTPAINYLRIKMVKCLPGTLVLTASSPPLRTTSRSTSVI